jgi:hypothetical protein
LHVVSPLRPVRVGLAGVLIIYMRKPLSSILLQV